MDLFHFSSLKISSASLKEKKAQEVKTVWIPIPNLIVSQKRQEVAWGQRLDKILSKKAI